MNDDDWQQFDDIGDPPYCGCDCAQATIICGLSKIEGSGNDSDTTSDMSAVDALVTSTRAFADDVCNTNYAAAIAAGVWTDVAEIHPGDEFEGNVRFNDKGYNLGLPPTWGVDTLMILRKFRFDMSSDAPAAARIFWTIIQTDIFQPDVGTAPTTTSTDLSNGVTGISSQEQVMSGDWIGHRDAPGLDAPDWPDAQATNTDPTAPATGANTRTIYLRIDKIVQVGGLPIA